jgi:hypothetical protein
MVGKTFGIPRAFDRAARHVIVVARPTENQ